MRYSLMLIFSLSCLGFACNSQNKKQAEKKQDSIEQTELDKVDQILLNEDSAIKAEEKRLMELYDD